MNFFTYYKWIIFFSVMLMGFFIESFVVAFFGSTMCLLTFQFYELVIDLKEKENEI